MHLATRPHLAWFIGDAAGARARFAAVRPHLAGVRVTVLSVGPAAPSVVGTDALLELPWAGTRRGGRASLRDWFGTDRPDLLVADGGAEVAAAATAAGIATVTVRRPGAGSDAPPTLPATPVGELAPYPAQRGRHRPASWPGERLVHPGLISRYSGRRPHRGAGRRALGLPSAARVVTVVCGRDGLGAATDLAAAAAATPGWTWVTVGRCGSPTSGLPANFVRLGWRDDPWPALEAADVVVGSGALSVVAEVASARRPLIVVPRAGRTDDAVHARRLDDLGAATALATWPVPEAWERLLTTVARGGTQRLSQLDDGRGPARTAEWLTAWAQTPPLAVPARHASTRPSARGRVVDLTRSTVEVGGRSS